MKVITVGARGQFEAIVDDDDYDYLIRFRWTFKRSSRAHGCKVYARRGVREGATVRSIYMHHEVAERAGKRKPSDLHTLDHRDRDTLNNARDNLAWKTPREQNLNRTRRTWADRHRRRVAAAVETQDEAIPF